MWKISVKKLVPDKIQHYSIEDGNRIIDFHDFIILLTEDHQFREFYNSVLADCPFDAFFWENPPVTTGSLSKPYEFVLINSQFLNSVTPDTTAFMSYFDPGEPVADFPNLSGDAWLIAPSLAGPLHYYTHIGTFVRHAPNGQNNAFWKRVGEKYSEMTGKQKIWLSTSGLGVYWLHVRIDNFPKYYQYNPYKY